MEAELRGWDIVPEDKRHGGRSLPLALVRDPNWWFFCLQKGHFRRWHVARIDELLAKARSILVGDDRVVVYVFDPFMGGIEAVRRVREDKVPHHSSVIVKPYFDFGMIQEVPNDETLRKAANRILLRGFKKIVMGDPDWRLTEKRIQSFFADGRNFAARRKARDGFIKVRVPVLWEVPSDDEGDGPGVRKQEGASA